MRPSSFIPQRLLLTTIALILILLTSSSTSSSSASSNAKQHSGKARILYGSCHSTKLNSPLWTHILSREPDLWIFGGDNMYADRLKTENALLTAVLEFKLPFEKATAADLEASYRALHAVPLYKKLLDSGVKQIAIWDDHDYGISESLDSLCGKQLCYELTIWGESVVRRWRQDVSSQGGEQGDFLARNGPCKSE